MKNMIIKNLNQNQNSNRHKIQLVRPKNIKKNIHTDGTDIKIITFKECSVIIMICYLTYLTFKFMFI